ncbi:hypothetical protein PGT21_007373 [Puccinia graminis f. sp. tritici]|uniref:Uncharacterized protein n=1 Tax=Puccinia graminis f. sp. tritici TaxID=56615 RepID=A0A5B0PTQ9_PUCGR|nr:hypothetical protein PGTUg99_006892 [Puccinia graminis f. sp. tritici]KAA1104014.1 hypothetical protein PGT21_007373 [Puccinia graminis f. sp. tritici]
MSFDPTAFIMRPFEKSPSALHRQESFPSLILRNQKPIQKKTAQATYLFIYDIKQKNRYPYNSTLKETLLIHHLSTA